jgi:hypothetical protein
VADLELDEIEMAEMTETLSRWNPYFQLPDQMDVEDIRLRDLHHFVCNMTEGHAVQ